MMDVNTPYHRAVELFADRVNAVKDVQWEDPTPCTEWGSPYRARPDA
jgi:hypothetical protein